jgi:hypothetical protein
MPYPTHKNLTVNIKRVFVRKGEDRKGYRVGSSKASRNRGLLIIQSHPVIVGTTIGRIICSTNKEEV